MARIEDTLKLGPWNMGVRYDLPSEDISPKGFRQMENVRLSAAAAAEKVLGTTSYAGASAIAAAPTLTACGSIESPAVMLWSLPLPAPSSISIPVGG